MSWCRPRHSYTWRGGPVALDRVVTFIALPHVPQRSKPRVSTWLPFGWRPPPLLLDRACGSRMRSAARQVFSSTMGSEVPEDWFTDRPHPQALRNHTERTIRDIAERTAMVALAGGAATQKAQKTSGRVSADDLRRVHEIARRLTSDDAEIGPFLRWMESRRSPLLELPHVWRSVEMISAALLERHQLDGEELLTIWKDAIKGRSD
jgi:hypothetical protein